MEKLRLNKIGQFLAVALLSVTFLSPRFFGEEKNRGLASCEDPVLGETLPDYSLFSDIRDEALRASALEYYAFLSQVEARALAGREFAFRSYGLPSTLSPQGVLQPHLAAGLSADPFTQQFATGQLWGTSLLTLGDLGTIGSLPGPVQNAPSPHAPLVSVRSGIF